MSNEKEIVKNELTLSRLNEILNNHFSEPFLPNGLVKSELSDDNIIITIGRRAVVIDTSGEVTDTCTEIN
jgi:hypothetical protein